MRTLQGKTQNFAMTSGIWKYLPSTKYAAENKRSLEKLPSEILISANF